MHSEPSARSLSRFDTCCTSLEGRGCLAETSGAGGSSCQSVRGHAHRSLAGGGRGGRRARGPGAFTSGLGPAREEPGDSGSPSSAGLRCGVRPPSLALSGSALLVGRNATADSPAAPHSPQRVVRDAAECHGHCIGRCGGMPRALHLPRTVSRASRASPRGCRAAGAIGAAPRLGADGPSHSNVYLWPARFTRSCVISCQLRARHGISSY